MDFYSMAIALVLVQSVKMRKMHTRIENSQLSATQNMVDFLWHVRFVELENSLSMAFDVAVINSQRYLAMPFILSRCASENNFHRTSCGERSAWDFNLRDRFNQRTFSRALVSDDGNLWEFDNFFRITVTKGFDDPVELLPTQSIIRSAERGD